MLQRGSRRLLLITDDDFVAEAIEMYLRGDGIEVVRTPDGDASGDALLVDLSKRGISGDAMIALAFRAQRAKIPLLVMSAQPRREVTEFAAVVRANDIVSKTERMSAIAARLRMWINADRHEDPANPVGFVIPELAASA
jgi:DNA-binding response OmpR family regulator